MTKEKKKVIQLAYGEMAPYALRSLLKEFIVAAIVTPPEEAQRYRTKYKLPVELIAEENNIPVLRTNNYLDIKELMKKNKPDVLVICSYNKILPSEILTLTKCINVHHGDLPRWRGRANLNWAIITGRKKVGITIHEAIPELDAGNIYSQRFIPISNHETITTLYKKVNNFVEKDLGKTVDAVLKGQKGKPQKGKATYCCTRLPIDGYINWSNSSLEIDRLIRALTLPFPGAYTFYEGEKMTILSSELPKKPRIYEGRISGRISLLHKNIGVEIITGTSSLIIKEVIYKNKKVNASEVIRTVNTTLGINPVEIYEQLQKMQKELENLRSIQKV